ncbi:RING finger protein 24 [Datura stramonium]|uniref:RING-type E3 ubiquitin transferase n=1 Tax=Datura stramonium TaxID=4076 RepID=A0ABS8VDX0_DATST|nr:RING finger protein 24 [Datura stramonium]
MESNKSIADNLIFGETLNAATNSSPANEPRDESTTPSMGGSKLSLIQEVQAAYQELGHSYCAIFSGNADSGEKMADAVNSSTQTMIPAKFLHFTEMESYRSHTDNETFSGTLNATSSSTPANVPKDGSTTECLVGSILSLIQELQASYQKLGHSYRAHLAANGARMEDVVNSSTETLIPVKFLLHFTKEREGDFGEDEDDEHDPTTENVSSEILLKLHEHMNVGSRVKAFYLSINLHKYESPKSTCLESKEHCCLCLVDYCDGEDLAKIDCGHVYHIDCIKEWIKLKNSCPICKRIALAALT